MKLSNTLKKYSAFILTGDFNAHHSMWGSNHDCPSGKNIVENLDWENFYLLNDKQATHINVTRDSCSFSNIDLAFVSPQLALTSEFAVLDDSWGSDHFPLEVTLNTEPKTTSKKTDYRYNLKKVNWEKFEEDLNNEKHIFEKTEFTNLDPLTRYSLFLEFLNKCILSSLPVQKPLNSTNIQQKTSNCNKKHLKGKSQCIWWNEDCEKVTRIRKATQKSIKHRCNLELFINYNKIQAVTRRTLKQEKIKSFINFCESINRTMKIIDIWRKIRKFKNSFSRPISMDGNQRQIENANRCLEELCQPKVLPEDFPPFEMSEDPCEQEHLLDSLLFYEELEYALNSVKLKSAPGKDKINYEFLSHLPESLKRVLLDLYNELYQGGLTPDDWKVYIVSLILVNDKKYQ